LTNEKTNSEVCVLNRNSALWVALIAAHSFAFEMPSVSKLGVGYYQYMTHWTGEEKRSFLWKKRESFGRNQSPGQNLKIVVADLELNMPYNSFLKVKAGYHFNSVEDYSLSLQDFGENGSEQLIEKRETIGFEDLELSLGYDYHGTKLAFKYIAPLIAEYEPMEGNLADAWSGFGVIRLGVELETVKWDTWLDVQSHYVISEGEYSRVKPGGFDFKAMGFRGVEISKALKAHYGVISSFQSYEWYKYIGPEGSKRKSPGNGALQREYQVEPHFGLGLNALGLEYKIDLGFTLYSATYTEFDAVESIVFDDEGSFIPLDNQKLRPQSEWTDAPRQLIFGLSVNKYF
jgi:hypothetical protein